MQTRRWWTLPLLLGCLSAALTADLDAQTPDKSPTIERKELDAAIFKTLRTVINQGAELYNTGDSAGCYRLYEGALMAIRLLVGHHPELQKTIDTALVEASRSPKVDDRAFVLRKAIDEVRRETAPVETIKKPEQPQPKVATLWDRLGGEKNVSRVIDNFVALVLTDPRIKSVRHPGHVLNEMQLAEVKKGMVAWISSVSGGPIDYKGKSLKEVHKDKGVTNVEFDVAEDHLREC